MKKPNILFTTIAAMSLSVILLSGCGEDKKPGASAGADGHADHDDHAGHDHPSEGPHHGSLIELGSNEEYHAELVHDEKAGSVTIYMLDSSAKKSVPIEATELLINLSHDGEMEQFKLAAKPDTDDPSGKSSRFVSTDEELAEDLDHEGAEAKLVVTIDGKQYHGSIEHDHDHEDHDEHDDDDEDDHGHDH